MDVLGADSFSILFNHRSFPKPDRCFPWVFDGFLKIRITGKNGEGTLRDVVAKTVRGMTHLASDQPKQRAHFLGHHSNKGRATKETSVKRAHWLGEMRHDQSHPRSVVG